MVYVYFTHRKPSPECKTDNDCAPGYKCVTGKCVPIPSPPVGCKTNNDCIKGYECVNGKCVPIPSPPTPPVGCKTNSDCIKGYECVNGKCVVVKPTEKCETNKYSPVIFSVNNPTNFKYMGIQNLATQGLLSASYNQHSIWVVTKNPAYDSFRKFVFIQNPNDHTQFGMFIYANALDPNHAPIRTWMGRTTNGKLTAKLGDFDFTSPDFIWSYDRDCGLITDGNEKLMLSWKVIPGSTEQEVVVIPYDKNFTASEVWLLG